MGLNHYRFRSVWTVLAGFEETFAAVGDLASYPLWWPEIKRVDLIDPDRARVTIAALLPYSLTLVMQRQVLDRDTGMLEAGLSGDLQGWSSWKVSRAQGGCLLVFEEQVEMKRRLLRLIAPAARPAFLVNHALMMKRGEAGLRRHLAGGGS